MADKPHVSYTFTDSGGAYMRSLIDSGVLEGPIGSQAVNPKLSELIAAMHHVLAGGDATVTLSDTCDTCDSSTFSGLESGLQSSVKDANRANAGGGPIVMFP